jgi:hypothetical protein
MVLLRILAVALNRGFDLWEFLIRAQDPLNRRGSSSHMRMTNSTCSSGNPDSPAIPASRMIRRRPYAGRLTAPSRRDDRRVTGGSPAGHRKMREVGAAAVIRARGRRGKEQVEFVIRIWLEEGNGASFWRGSVEEIESSLVSHFQDGGALLPQGRADVLRGAHRCSRRGAQRQQHGAGQVRRGAAEG